MRLPAIFTAWCFLPAHGVVKIHVLPTVLNPDKAEVMEVSASIFERGHLAVTPSIEDRARMDDAGCFALDLFCMRLGFGESVEATEEHVEKTTLVVADKQQTAWLAAQKQQQAMALNEAQNRIARAREGRAQEAAYTHPEDATLPAWME